MKILFDGNGSRDGMCQRFENHKKIDRNIHPIPLLANGPGTGKSRSLQEIPTLLREHAENYTNDDELLNRIKDRMYAINVTFGNSTPENCGALEIVLKDIDTDIDIIIFGIDELNILHNKRGHDNPVREIVHAIGVLNCSGSGSPFYVPILAGTIQGPLEEMFRESTYRFLPLPLHLLREREVRKISEFVACSEHNHALKITLRVKFANIVTPAIAHAILNIPVSKDDEADKGGKVSYIDLSSEELKRDNEDLFKGTYNLNEFGFLEHQESEFKLPDESSIKYREPKHHHAEFSEANDKLDVNTASEYELRTVEKVKEKTAREILLVSVLLSFININKRLFRLSPNNK
ncbi:unnamed protein product [Rhizophagus irregularis]|nr:unnamed protein product [Rhizophagus irregularis]